MVGIEGVYKTELLARIKDYSVGPKAPQPVQSAEIIEATNQAAYRGNFPTPDKVRKMEQEATGLELSIDARA